MLAVRANSLPRVQLTLEQQQGQGRQHCAQWKIRCNLQQALGTAVLPYPWLCITDSTNHGSCNTIAFTVKKSLV